MHLQGSCHCGKIRFSVEAAEPVPFMRCYCSICRKTAGSGGYAINLGAVAQTLKLTGQRYLGIYRARLGARGKVAGHPSSARRHFCTRCGTALWIWDPTWPELIHPHAGAIDTKLPVPPENVHCLTGSRAPWVRIEGEADDPCFKAFPPMSLAQWHADQGLTSATKAAASRRQKAPAPRPAKPALGQ